MTANTSSAVMQQRREAHDSLDDFPTPPWATRALIERLIADLEEVPALRSAREPAANRGHMVRPLREARGARASASPAGGSASHGEAREPARSRGAGQ